MKIYKIYNSPKRWLDVHVEPGRLLPFVSIHITEYYSVDLEQSQISDLISDLEWANNKIQELIAESETNDE